MTFSLDEVGFLPTDRIVIDGISCRFVANSATGFLFVSDGERGGTIEIPASDLAGMMGEPGRFQVEPEFFKKKGKRK